MTAMTDVGRLFQAFVAPAIFVSATALLVLSINVRLMGIVARLRHYIHLKYEAEQGKRIHEVHAYTAQIESIERRAELIRRCFLSALVSLAGSVAACTLFGLGIYFPKAAYAAAVVFVCALLALFVAAIFYMLEVRLALSSVRDEARHLHDLRSKIS